MLKQELVNIKCIIIDDEPLAIEVIRQHLAKIPNLEVIASCNNAMEGFDILRSKHVDLIFLDIQMPLLTGIEFMKSLSHPPKVIFTTAYREYAVESYELDVIDYLLKPISFERLFKAVNKYFNTVGPNQLQPVIQTIDEDPEFMFVNVNKKHHKVYFNDVLYAESLKDYIRIHTREKSFLTKEKISAFEEKMPGYFLRTHRSYIVNINNITAYTTHDVEIDDIEIPVGVSYKNHVFKVLNREKG